MKVNKKSFVMLGGVLLLLLFFTLSFTGLRGKEGFGIGGDDDEDLPYTMPENSYDATIDDVYYKEHDGNELPSKKPTKNINEEDAYTFSNIEGFEGALPHLQPENSTSEEQMLDIFSQVEGKLSCGPVSSQLHNSRGGLCLNADQQKLLQTRGGNAAGGDSQIGF